MTPKKTKFGIHTNDFFLEDRKYAVAYECVFCKIVSPNNYCLYCNHCICEDCICMRTKEKCPKDNTDIINNIRAFQNNLIGKALLDNLKINCIFQKEGCRWVGIFQDFENYHLPVCKFKFNKNNINDDLNNLNNDKENSDDGNDNKDEINGENMSYDSDINSDNKDNNKNNLINKKKNHSNEININNDNNNDNDDNVDDNNDDDNNDDKSSSFNNIFNNKQNNLDIEENQSSSCYYNNSNDLSKSKNNLLPEEEDLDENKLSSSNLESSSWYENFEKTNNTILIDSNLTLNIFPYYYYFTEPLYNSFTCIIKVISRNILRDNKEISFGLTNINNNEYKEILSTKAEKYNFVIYKRDIIRISYDNDLFLIYFENDKNNNYEVPFKNNELIRYYPTIILNNSHDILEVSHD